MASNKFGNKNFSPLKITFCCGVGILAGYPLKRLLGNKRIQIIQLF